jgi:hypothetical protein
LNGKVTKKRQALIMTALTLVLLSVSALQGRKLMDVRESGPQIELRDAPPIVVFTSVVLGGFKGILADVLWLRASILQDEGRYLELVQLADWVTKLEPGISEIWSFHAWNMAYNVSVMMPKAADRWRWVQNGISLLRDEGLLYNSRDPKLYFELGWLFQHKLGEPLDAMHLYYKRQWAEQMGAFTRENGRVDYDSLTDENKDRLRNEYKLDPEVMKYLDGRYGPFDWRLPEATAAYWGHQGVKAAGDKGYIACDRVVYQSIMQMFRRGRLTFDKDSGRYEVAMDPGMLTGTMKAFEDVMRSYPGDGTVRDSYALFLREAVRRLHAAGLEAQARYLFIKLSTEYGAHDTKDGYDSFLKFNEVYDPRAN